MAVNPKIAALLAKARASAGKAMENVAAEAVISMDTARIDDSSAVAVVEQGVVQSVAVAAQPTAVQTYTAASNPQSVDLSPQQYLVVEKIEALKQSLLAGDPMLPTLLRYIHTALHKDPELVHFLEPEQIGVITKAAFNQARIVVVTTATKKATTQSGKKLSATTLDDI